MTSGGAETPQSLRFVRRLATNRTHFPQRASHPLHPLSQVESHGFWTCRRDSPLAGTLSVMPHQLQRFGDMVVFWWETATPTQFLSVALTIVILGWFVSKLGS